jgi:DNA adenine methylase
MFKNIQNNPRELFDAIQLLKERMDKETYYEIREKYNKMSVEEKREVPGSAIFIFLNKTCFRGMFREGPNGFNVPYGNYKNPEVINWEHLEEIHTLIQGVQFECIGITESLQKIEKGDFVFVDPPYFPVDTKSFVKYTKEGFSLTQHCELFTLLQEMQEKFMLCNADVPFVAEYFVDYNKIQLTCKRSIHSKNPGAKAQEIIIMNY